MFAAVVLLAGPVLFAASNAAALRINRRTAPVHPAYIHPAYRKA